MGEIFDTKKIDTNLRCTDVKSAVMIITYVGLLISPLFLIIAIILMLCNKKGNSFINIIIIFIFSSELLNIVSKGLQLLKYAFEDTREKPHTNKDETPRGNICQIQIVFSIIADFCSLLGTLLLSLRCNEIIKSKNRCFDKKKYRILSFVIIISFSLIVSITLLFIDRSITWDSYGYTFDLRDRCSYWCWLEHKTSMICYGLYIIILISNLILAWKNHCLLDKAYDKLKNQIETFSASVNDLTENNNSGDNSEGKRHISPEDKERIGELSWMRIRCMIYPWVTITIWVLAAIYRFIDDIIMNEIDNVDSDRSEVDEKTKFDENPGLRILEEAILVMHTTLSAFRGLVYGLVFIIFEENCIGKCFRKHCDKFCYRLCCCIKYEDFDDIEESENNSSKSIPVNKPLLSDSIGKESNEEDQNLRSASEGEIGRNSEMNNSNYHFND